MSGGVSANATERNYEDKAWRVDVRADSRAARGASGGDKARLSRAASAIDP